MNMKNVPTPCYVIDRDRLVENLKILKYVEEKSGAHVLLAQKAFSAFCMYPLISEYLSGTTASGLFAMRRCRAKRCMSFRLLTPRRRWMSL